MRRTRALMLSTGLLAVTVALGGIAAGALIRSDHGDPVSPVAPAVVSAAASATDVDSGARMTVTLTAKGGSAEVRAKLTGLKKGTGYRLYGYGVDDSRWPVANWTGKKGKVQEVTGTVPAGIPDISHFAVLRGDRSAVVTVYLPRGVGADIGPNGG
ncbi:hypothetical protein [Actinoplanes sp. NPDC051494]|uniref:hypothetical protein n=1 Tax=Actinoplanes sp. NPDC051494 TaxID=3363907 RepID=UPI0037B7DCB3